MNCKDISEDYKCYLFSDVKHCLDYPDGCDECGFLYEDEDDEESPG